MTGWRETGDETTEERQSRDFDHGNVREPEGTSETIHVYNPETEQYEDVTLD